MNTINLVPLLLFTATKPLLRQIENLQAAHSAQSANWDKIEASLTQRLGQECMCSVSCTNIINVANDFTTKVLLICA